RAERDAAGPPVAARPRRDPDHREPQPRAAGGSESSRVRVRVPSAQDARRDRLTGSPDRDRVAAFPACGEVTVLPIYGEVARSAGGAAGGWGGDETPTLPL